MKNAILITTTSSVEGAAIIKYFDIISTNVVVGTNFFSDFGASFSDLFGGYSNTYQNKLHDIRKVAFDKLSQQAATMGANAIIGIRMDFDEISGKGKSMFMVSLSGMAVSLKYTNPRINQDAIMNLIDSDDLEKELMRRSIQTTIASNQLPSNEQWLYLLNYPVDDIVGYLLERYLQISHIQKETLYDDGIALVNYISPYLSVCSKEIVTDALYAQIVNKFTPIHTLIVELKRFSAKHISELINNNKLAMAIKCLSAQQQTYDSTDLRLMTQLQASLSQLPDVGKIDIVKGLMSKAKNKYICPQGHPNNVEGEYCNSCGQNIKGLTLDQTTAIAAFNEKIDALKALIDRSEQ